MVSKREIQAARKAAKLGSMKESEIYTHILGATTSAYMLKGMTIADGLEESSRQLADSIRHKIESRYRHLTSDELALAFDYGVTGEFGGDKRMTPSTALFWLSQYDQHPMRKEVIGEENLPTSRKKESASDINDPTAGMSFVEKMAYNEKVMDGACIRVWNEYVHNGCKLDIYLEGFADCVYRHLLKRGKFTPNPKTEAEAWRRSRMNVTPDKRGDFPGKMDWAAEREYIQMYFDHLASNGNYLQI